MIIIRKQKIFLWFIWIVGMGSIVVSRCIAILELLPEVFDDVGAAVIFFLGLVLALLATFALFELYETNTPFFQ